MAKHADAELDVMITDTVPPPDISKIGIFRAPMAKHAKKVGQYYAVSFQNILELCLLLGDH